MKKVLKIKNVLIVATILSMLSCSSDDDSNNGQINNAITVQDFSVTVNENPINGQSLGTVSASSSETLLYSIVSSSPANALSIDANTGELTVDDETLFDFETNPTITASITVENSTEIETINVNISLEDIAEVGEFKYGGVIFWVNATGDEGLVCATTDQSLGTTWRNGVNTVTGAVETAIGTGQANTSAIITAQGSGSYAAQLCDDLSLNGYDDWFLPSKDELFELLNNKTIVNATSIANSGSNLGTQYYWSSSEISLAYAAIYFNPNGNVYFANGSKSTSSYHVRAVRSWTDF